MRSVLSATDFITTAPTGGVAGLNRGELALVNSGNQFVASAADVAKSDTLRFVVGLGDGNVKYGVILNPRRMDYNYTAYEAATPTTVVISNVVIAAPNAPYFYDSGSYACVNINIPPKNWTTNFPMNSVDALVEVKNSTETTAQIKARLEAEIQKQVDAINLFYGLGSITFTGAGTTTWTFTTALKPRPTGAGLAINLEGLVSGDIATTGGSQGHGIGADVLAHEQNEDVANVGFDPNYAWWQSPLVYGPDIFTTDAGTNYNQWVIRSRADRTHPFDINTLGMEVWQFIAMATSYTGTDLTTILDALTATSGAAIAGQISAVDAKVTALDARVTALEP